MKKSSLLKCSLLALALPTYLSAQNTPQEKNAFFLSLGTFKSIQYNAPVIKKNYLGFLSFQAGYVRKLPTGSQLVLNAGLAIKYKGPVGECFEYCESESVKSLSLKLRLEKQVLNQKVTLGAGAGLTLYDYIQSEMYDDSLNVKSGEIKDTRLGLGLDLVGYYNLGHKWKIGINYYPNLYEFRERKIKYYHTLIMEVRYDLSFHEKDPFKK
jgi:hypothetical protein